MLKRPMCLISLAFTIVIYLVLCIVPPPGFKAAVDGQSIHISGQVYQKEFKNGKQILYLEHVIIQKSSQETSQSTSQDTHQPYKAIVYLEEKQAAPSVKMGSAVALSGKLRLFSCAENDGQFDAYRYYQTLGIDFSVHAASISAIGEEYSEWRELLHQFREKMKAVYHKFLPEQEAGVLQALILGDKSELSAEIKDLYMQAGIAHILSLSGLHIATAGMCILALLRRLNLKILPAGIISAILMVNFGMMTGMGTSTFRALVMFLLGVLALCTGRTYDILSALSVAAVLILLENPLYLYHSGFQLSFGAILGIGLVYPCLSFLIPKLWMKKKLVQTIAVSLSIQIATLPIVLYSFFQFSAYGILTNLIVVPLMTFVLALGFLGGLIGMISDLLGGLLLLPCRYILLLYEWLSGLSTAIPGSVWIAGKPDLWKIGLYYVLLFGLVIVLSRLRDKYKYETWHRTHAIVTRIVCSGVMLTAIIFLVYRSKGEFTLTMLSVGQGECTVICGNEIPTIMIDGGSTDVSEVGKYRIITYLKANALSNIDIVFISHTDNDHISGILEILQAPKSGIHIKQLVLPAIGQELQNEAYAELISSARSAGTQVYSMGAGEVYRVGSSGTGTTGSGVDVDTGSIVVAAEDCGTGDACAGDITITCLHPVHVSDAETEIDSEIEIDSEHAEDMNESSMVLLVNYVNLDVLFTGDISSSVEAKLQQTVKDCDVLKIAHHGSRFSTSSSFLKATQPEIALISSGKHNSYGHPHEEVLERLKEQDVKWLRTDECGAIEIESNGEEVWFRTFK